MKKLRILYVLVWLCLVIGFPGVSGTVETEQTSLIKAINARSILPSSSVIPAAAGDLLDSFTSPITNPIAIDYDTARGGVWITSESDQIVRVDVNTPYVTQQILSLVGIAIAEDGHSDGVAVLPNGNLLLCDYNGDGANIDDYLFEINPDTGILVNYWPLDGVWNTSTDGTFIDLVIDVEMGPNGHVYVTSAFDGNAVYEVALVPGKPGTWRTVTVHTATTVNDVVGIDRAGCPTGWWVSDFNSTNVALLDSSFATVSSFAADHDWNFFNTGVTVVTNTYPIKLWTVDYDTSTIGVFDTDQEPTNVELLSPSGDNVATGSTYKIQWCAPSNAVSFKLAYSLDNGSTWKALAKEYADTIFSWYVLLQPNNKKRCLAKVKAFNSDGLLVGTDKSDSTFAIEVIKVTFPNGGETLTPGDPHTITWITNATKRPVAKVRLYYTKNGGVNWNLIGETSGDPGSYSWTVPALVKTKGKCKVKVKLMDASGNILGQDKSDRCFVIQPAP